MDGSRSRLRRLDAGFDHGVDRLGAWARQRAEGAYEPSRLLLGAYVLAGLLGLLVGYSGVAAEEYAALELPGASWAFDLAFWFLPTVALLVALVPTVLRGRHPLVRIPRHAALLLLTYLACWPLGVVPGRGDATRAVAVERSQAGLPEREIADAFVAGATCSVVTAAVLVAVVAVGVVVQAARGAGPWRPRGALVPAATLSLLVLPAGHLVGRSLAL